MKKWQIPVLIYNETTQFNYGLSYTNEAGDTVNIYSTTDFFDKLMYKYTSWAITSPVFFDPVSGQMVHTAQTIDQALTLFHKIYTLWRNDRLPGFAKLYEAMRKDYNPIWNVDGVTGIITEDTHTGTDTVQKRGTDTSRLSGQDKSTASGSDINTLSGRDIDTLSGQDVDKLTGTDTTTQSGTDVKSTDITDTNTASGTDTERITGTDSTLHTGTITDAHTGTITDAKDVTKDETTYDGRELHQRTGDEVTGTESATFDSGATMHPTTKTTLHYPGLSESNARADITEFDHRKDSHLYNDTNTHTLNNTDTRTNNNTDAITYGKVDATTYGKVDTKVIDQDESTTYGRSDATQYGKTDTVQYGKVDTMQYGKVDTLQHGKVDTMQYGKQDQMTYNTTDTDTKDLQDKHVEMQIRQGNIGVTSTQKMLNEEIDLRSRDALIDYMIADFIHTNCII